MANGRIRAAAGCLLGLALFSAGAASAAGLADTARSLAAGVAALPECKGASVAIAISGKIGAGTALSGTVAYGSGPAQPADADTIYEIGSVTKTFTALLLAEAVAKQMVKLDDPVAKYLPAGTVVPVFQEGGQAYPIRLIDLATHSSGLPRAFADARYPFSSVQMYAELAKLKLTRRPGTKWEYSNLGFSLLTAAMESLFKAPLDRLLADHITTPLKMGHTRLVFDTSDGAKIPIGYAKGGGKDALYQPTWPAFNGSGAIRSSLADMQKYLAFAMGGAGDLTKLRPLLFDWHTYDRADAPGKVEQGLAWQRVLPFGNGVDVVWKDGDVAGFTSFVAFSEKLGEGTVVLTNRVGCDAERAAMCIMRAASEASGLAANRGPNCSF